MAGWKMLGKYADYVRQLTSSDPSIGWVTTTEKAKLMHQYCLISEGSYEAYLQEAGRRKMDETEWEAMIQRQSKHKAADNHDTEDDLTKYGTKRLADPHDKDSGTRRNQLSDETSKGGTKGKEDDSEKTTIKLRRDESMESDDDHKRAMLYASFGDHLIVGVPRLDERDNSVHNLVTFTAKRDDGQIGVTSPEKRFKAKVRRFLTAGMSEDEAIGKAIKETCEEAYTGITEIANSRQIRSMEEQLRIKHPELRTQESTPTTRTELVAKYITGRIIETCILNGGKDASCMARSIEVG